MCRRRSLHPRVPLQPLHVRKHQAVSPLHGRTAYLSVGKLRTSSSSSANRSESILIWLSIPLLPLSLFTPFPIVFHLVRFGNLAFHPLASSFSPLVAVPFLSRELAIAYGG